MQRSRANTMTEGVDGERSYYRRDLFPSPVMHHTNSLECTSSICRWYAHFPVFPTNVQRTFVWKCIKTSIGIGFQCQWMLLPAIFAHILSHIAILFAQSCWGAFIFMRATVNINQLVMYPVPHNARKRKHILHACQASIMILLCRY